MNVQEAIATLTTVAESLQRDRTWHEKRIQRLEWRLMFAHIGVATSLLLTACLSLALLNFLT